MSQRALLAASWTAVVVLLCLFPASMIPVREEAAFRSQFVPHLDKLIHAGLFLAVGILWMRVRPGSGWTVAVLCGGLALAILTELGQGMPGVGRDPDMLDALADVAGLVLGLGAFWAWRAAVAAPRPAALALVATREV